MVPDLPTRSGEVVVARAVWSGSLRLGLATIRVRLYPAVTSREVRFRLLDIQTRARIRHRRVSSATGEDVPWERVVNGYEIAPGRYVLVTRAELDAIRPKATHTIDVHEFVLQGSIDPRHYGQAYYLIPELGRTRAYSLLQRAMAETHTVAIARLVLRTRPVLAAIRPIGAALCLQTMRFAEELVPPGDLDGIPDPDDVGARELGAARHLIEALATEFHQDRYRDEYRGEVLGLIARKAEAQEPVTPSAAEEPVGVRELLAALEADVTERGTG
jgi:DNA end-binding protein Ku